MIPPETIALVRDRTNIVAVIQESVPSLKKRGRSWLGLCPFHKEKTASFHVNPDRGFFHCFGCKESGSAIDFLMKHDGYSFPEAVRALAERCGIEIEEEKRPREEVDRAKKHKDDLYAALSVAASYYERQLREHPDREYALRELLGRGLLPSWARENPTDPTEAEAKIDDVLQAFRIGYAPSGWDGLANHLRSQGISPSVAEQVGLLVPKSTGSGHYDRFRHRLMFAVTDPQGRVVAFSGRALEPMPGDEKDSDQKPAKYINSPESTVYTKGQLLFGVYQARHAIRQADQAILVEGNFDVVSLHARSIENVVAPLGTAFTPEQAKLLRRYAGSVVVFFDSDAAGKKATRASREACRSAGLFAKVAVAPSGKDPDELVRTSGPEAIKDAISGARGMLEFLLDAMFDETFGGQDLRVQVQRVERAIGLIAEEDDPLARSLAKSHADRILGRLDLVRREDDSRGERSPDILRHLEVRLKKALAVEQAKRTQTQAADPRQARIAPQPQGRAAHREIVGALIDYPELLDDDGTSDLTAFLSGEQAQIVAALARSFRWVDGVEGPEKRLDNDAFLAQMPPAIHSLAAQRLAAPKFETVEEARDTIQRSAAALHKLALQRDARENVRDDEEWESILEKSREHADRVTSTRGIRPPKREE